MVRLSRRAYKNYCVGIKMNNGFVCNECKLTVYNCKVCNEIIEDDENTAFCCFGKYHTHSRCKTKLKLQLKTEK